MTARTPRGQQGFTLIEVMISLAILAFMMAVTWSTTVNTVDSKKSIEAYEARNHELRIGMTRMVHDISMAYLSVNDDVNAPERRTFFIEKGGGDVDELRFSSFAHVSLFADANESEQTVIAYSAEQDPRQSAKTNLVRRESRRLSNERWDAERAEIDVLVHDIESVHFSHWDFREEEWRDDWDSTAVDGQRGRLPTRVRITVTIKGRDDKPVELITQARIMMEEELRFLTN